MPEPIYLVWSNAAQAWWGPGASGYRHDIWLAGRYDEENARKACSARTWSLGSPPPEVMVLAPENDQPSFTPDELRRLPDLMRERVKTATSAAKRRPPARLAKAGESGD